MIVVEHPAVAPAVARPLELIDAQLELLLDHVLEDVQSVDGPEFQLHCAVYCCVVLGAIVVETGMTVTETSVAAAAAMLMVKLALAVCVGLDESLTRTPKLN